MSYRRATAAVLTARLAEPPRKLWVVLGPRQVGKTTMVRQVLADRASPESHWFTDADNPGQFGETVSPHPSAGDIHFSPGRPADKVWLEACWRHACLRAVQFSKSQDESADMPPGNFVFVIDEVQKVKGWPELIKGLWDSTQAQRIPMHVVLLGSAPMLVQHGLTESLMGRFELLRMPHWSLDEMHEAFDMTLAQYVYFGGYPYAAELRSDEQRWRSFVRDSLIAPSIDRDVLQMARVDRPALMRQLFELGCQYSAQIVALTKLVGSLQDAGNTTTLTSYLKLLENAGLLSALFKYSPQSIRQRASKPKFQVLNTALQSACEPWGFEQARANPSHWGRLIESAVGAHLINTSVGETQLHYWNESPHEVDFVIVHRGRIAAIEVKSGKPRADRRGLREFQNRFGACVTHLIGSEGIDLGEFLSYPAAHWVE